MNTQDFCYWLQGYFELSGTDGGLSKEQVEVIKEHLQLVFKKQTCKKVSSLPKLSEDGQKRAQDLIRECEREVFKYKTAWPSDSSSFKPGIIPPAPPEPPPPRTICEDVKFTFPPNWFKCFK